MQEFVTKKKTVSRKITGKNPPKIPFLTPKNPTTEGGEKEDKKKGKGKKG